MSHFYLSHVGNRRRLESNQGDVSDFLSSLLDIKDFRRRNFLHLRVKDICWTSEGTGFYTSGTTAERDLHLVRVDVTLCSNPLGVKKKKKEPQIDLSRKFPALCLA